MSSDYSNLVFIVAMVAIFYFLLIRPQQRRAKQQQEMLAGLVSGMTIVTIGGIFATVIEVGERVRVRVYDGSELEIAKSAVSRIVESEPDQIEPSDIVSEE